MLTKKDSFQCDKMLKTWVGNNPPKKPQQPEPRIEKRPKPRVRKRSTIAKRRRRYRRRGRRRRVTPSQRPKVRSPAVKRPSKRLSFFFKGAAALGFASELSRGNSCRLGIKFVCRSKKGGQTCSVKAEKDEVIFMPTDGGLMGTTEAPKIFLQSYLKPVGYEIVS